jgi:hypothetical protein
MCKKAYAALSPCTNGQALLISDQLHRQKDYFLQKPFLLAARKKHPGGFESVESASATENFSVC